jgi:hypothetical protein
MVIISAAGSQAEVQLTHYRRVMCLSPYVYVIYSSAGNLGFDIKSLVRF